MGMFARRAAMAALVAGPVLPQQASIVTDFDADKLPVVANNTTLASWTDSVGGAVATLVAGTPKYMTNQIGTHPSVRFDGLSVMGFTSTPAKTAVDSRVYTTCIVFSKVLAKGNGMLFGNGVGGPNCFSFQADGTIAGRFDNQPAATTLLMAPLADSNLHVLVVTSTNNYPGASAGGCERLYIDGGLLSSNSAPGPVTSSTAFGIGAVNGTAATLPGKADIHRILQWNKALTPYEVKQLTKQLLTNYGMTPSWVGASKVMGIHSDSLNAAVGAGGFTHGTAYLVAQAMGLVYGQWDCFAVGGIQTTDMISNMSEWIDIPAFVGVPFKLHCGEWYNEKLAGKSATTIYNDLIAYTSAVRTAIAAKGGNVKISVETTTSYSGDPDATNRDAYNTLVANNIASGSPMADAIAALHTDASIGVTGAYAANSATYWSDQVHLNGAGYAIKAPYITAALQSI